MSNIIKEEEMKDSNIDIELVKYIEDEIFPLYNRNEEGHGIQHIKTVIKRSLELAKNYEVNLNMVYTIASYHDLGHYIDRKTHEIISAELFMKDNKIKQWFTDEQKRRSEVRPGITGLAQVRGRNGINIFKKINYDLEYVDNMNLWLDIKIFFDSIVAVFKKTNAEISENGIKDELTELKAQKEKVHI